MSIQAQTMKRLRNENRKLKNQLDALIKQLEQCRRVAEARSAPPAPEVPQIHDPVTYQIERLLEADVA